MKVGIKDTYGHNMRKKPSPEMLERKQKRLVAKLEGTSVQLTNLCKSAVACRGVEKLLPIFSHNQNVAYQLTKSLRRYSEHRNAAQ
jgi:hypothetical protein